VARADGLDVSWLLRIENVRSPVEDRPIEATFSMPYMITRGPHWRSSSSISVQAEFPADAVDKLMAVRRGDWVTVAGKVRVEARGRGARIEAARLVPDA
jgi:hypothetical protein